MTERSTTCFSAKEQRWVVEVPRERPTGREGRPAREVGWGGLWMLYDKYAYTVRLAQPVTVDAQAVTGGEWGRSEGKSNRSDD